MSFSVTSHNADGPYAARFEDGAEAYKAAQKLQAGGNSVVITGPDGKPYNLQEFFAAAMAGAFPRYTPG